MASGKKVRIMSDDPIAGKRIIGYRIDMFQSERYRENIEKTMAFQGVTDTTLNRMTEIMDEVKGLAVRGANASEDAASRRALGQSVDALLNRMVDLGNTVHDGRYIFAGTDVLNRPFDINENGQRVDYAGNLDDFEVDIGPAARATVNENGHALFKQEIDVFDGFIQLRDALNADDPDEVQRLITNMDNAHRHLVDLHGSLGSRIERVELSRVQLEEAEVNISRLLSDEQDADLAETIMELQNTEVALQAGLQAGARVIQPTLLDFI